jgi:hypothetical protein
MSATNRDDSDSTQTIFMSGPAGLARILAQDQPEAALWGPEEMRAMWLHQLRAPLEADLATVRSPGSSPLGNSPEALAFKDKSFNDLLLDQKPPLALLKLTKDFAKQTIKDTEDPHLKEIAAALYYCSYAASMTRCGKRLGGMRSHELKGGFEWALGREWLDAQSRALIAEASGFLDQENR